MEKSIEVWNNDHNSASGDGGSMRITLADLEKAIAKVPAEHRAAASILVTCYGDYASAYISLWYGREETEEERRQRENEEREREQRYAAEREAREKAEYARLKAKFANPEN